MESFLDANLEEGLRNDAKILKGDIADQITAYAAQKQCGLIMIATQGYRGFEKALFGSVADRVLKTAPCPVMTINPSQLGTATFKEVMP